MEDKKSLKGTAEDEIFHRSRVMFCIKDGEVKAAQGNNPLSHLEWFEKEGWTAGRSVLEFLNNNIRGFYSPQEDRAYFYKGMGWNFDDQLLAEVLSKAEEIKEALGLNGDTEIYLGPKDEYIMGQKQAKKFVGKLGDIIKGNR